MDLTSAVINSDLTWITNNIFNGTGDITWLAVLRKAIIYQRYFLIDIAFSAITGEHDIKSAIHTAVDFESEYLLKKISSKPEQFELALMYATKNQNKGALEYLAKCNPNKAIELSPYQKFMDAVYDGNPELISQLLDKLESKQKEEFLLEAIHYCISSDNMELLYFLVSKGNIGWGRVASLANKHGKLECADYCYAKIAKMSRMTKMIEEIKEENLELVAEIKKKNLELMALINTFVQQYNK